MKDDKFPRLMKDDTENDGNAETIMDYVLSWCFRRAQSSCAIEKPKLYEKCRFMLSKILKINFDSMIEYTSVKVWKQWERIDLIVEVDALVEGVSQKYAILIENKYYTPLHQSTDTDGVSRNQLEVYRKKFDAYYKQDAHFSQNQLRYALITCIDSNDKKFGIYYGEAKKYGFDTYFFYDLLKDNDLEQTESDIFNEFWLLW
jgi:hypothetical protein